MGVDTNQSTPGDPAPSQNQRSDTSASSDIFESQPLPKEQPSNHVTPSALPVDEAQEKFA